MRKLVALFVLVLLFSSLAAFADAETEAFDRKVIDELRALDPAAVPIWNAANAARDAERREEAVAKYAEVAKRVPSFHHALRRMSGMEAELGRRADALTHGRAALTIAHTPENLATVARLLVHGETTTDAEKEEARALAKEAVALQPKGLFEHAALADVAIASEDIDLLTQTSEKMRALAPKEPSTHVYRFVAAAAAGEWDAAQQALDEARTLGLPQPAYEQFSQSLADSKPFYLRWWKPVAIGVAIWAIAFALLLGTGALLSRAAMRAAHDTPENLAQNTTLLSDRVRKLYARVLGITSVYYYISLPIVMLLVVLTLGGVIYGFFAIGRVPIKLAIILVVMIGISLWSMIKSLFVRVSDEDPGRKLDLTTQPRLRALLDSVAQQIGTRAVDNVYLTPATEVAVMERGKGRNKERCLILGVAAIEALNVRPFKAILGHEYGHFTNRDTAGGAFALSVRRSLGATAVALAQGGAATWYNPAWLFVNGFFNVFSRISQGASRLQEILADRWAVFAYGASAFEEGLRAVVAQSVRFDAHIDATIREVVEGSLPLTNLYTYEPSNKPRGEAVEQEIAEAIARDGTVYDSHPPAKERFALAHALRAPEPAPAEDDHLPAWSLFADAEELQRSMTEQVRLNVRANTGIEIAATATA